MAGDQMLQRRDTASGWNTNNRVLGAGEFGLETDTRKVKFGDGVTPWNALQYINYLPLDGKAANADKLDGFDSSEFVLGTDVTEAATAGRIARRTSDGGLRVTTATDDDEAATFLQLKNGIVTAKQIPYARFGGNANFALVLADANSLILAGNNTITSVLSITVPADATVAFPVGTKIDIAGTSQGVMQVVAASGVNLRGDGRIYGVGGSLRLLKIGANDWLVLNRVDNTQTWPWAVLRGNQSETMQSGWQALLFRAAIENVGNGWSTDSVSAFYCPAGHSGIYEIEAVAAIANPANDQLFNCALRKNGNWIEPSVGNAVVTRSVNVYAITTGVRRVRLVAGDYVQAYAIYGGGTWGTFNDTLTTTQFNVRRVA